MPIPNLDEQSVVELEKFSEEILRDPTRLVLTLFPTLSFHKTTSYLVPYAVRRLGDYANARARELIAKENRESIKATIHKEQAERIFSTLPEFAKWK